MQDMRMILYNIYIYIYVCVFVCAYKFLHDAQAQDPSSRHQGCGICPEIIDGTWPLIVLIKHGEFKGKILQKWKS